MWTAGHYRAKSMTLRLHTLWNLRMEHEQITTKNRIAWEAQSYQAWVYAYGAPEQAALTLLRDPTRKLKKILPHLPNPKGERIANPLGSHGRIAVSLALLGASVSVFDISATNKRYAIELAQAAKVDLDYVVGDFLQTPSRYDRQFDRVVMELGVLHYFSHLDSFVSRTFRLLKPGGTVILNDFHPLLKKAIIVSDNGVELIGDYFSTDVERANTPYEIFLKDQAIPECLIRRWNLGEIVTAFANNGFRVNKLIEEAGKQIAQLPDTFTLVATAD